MPDSKSLVSTASAPKLLSRIFEIRGMLIMIDFDLAELYEVETKVLNQTVKRNLDRFPPDFMFQLTDLETESLRSQIVTSNAADGFRTRDLRSQNETSNTGRGGRRYLPYAFTEQGVAMLSGVLRSPRAVEVNIAIMRAFVELRRWSASNEDLARRLANLERRSDEQYRQVVKVLESFERRLRAGEASKDGRIGFRKGSAKRA